MKLVCPTCGRGIAGADVDLASGRAVCRPCSEVYSLEQLGAPASASRAVAVLRPADLEWHEESSAGGWRAVARPPRDGAVSMIAFGLFFTLISLPFALVIIGLLHFSVGVRVLYAAIARLLNRVELGIEGGSFTVRQAPLPRGRVEHPVEEIVRFFAAKSERRGFGNVGQLPWGVQMATGDGRSVRLPIELPDEEHAAFFAGRMNAALERARVGANGPYRVAVDPGVEAYRGEEDAEVVRGKRSR